MADTSPPTAMSAQETKKIEQFKLLFDYTKFHIGLYTTLAAAYIALMASEYGKRILAPNILWVVAAVAAFVIAGGAGGTIASSCTRLVGLHFEGDPLEQKVFPYRTVKSKWRFPGWKVNTWARIEHTAFWIGLVCVIASVAFPSHTKLALEVPASRSMTLFEWIVQKDASDHRRLVEFGSERAIVLCIEPGGHVELVLDGSADRKHELGGKTESECKALYARVVSAKSMNGQRQKGRLAVALDK